MADPSADAEPSAARRALGPVGGCLGGCASAVMVVGGALVAGIFTVRDTVSTYAAAPARAVGLHWFAAQPRPAPGEACVPEACCTLTWRRNGLSSAWYRITCEATDDVALSGFALVSEDVANGWVYEDQRPMSGDSVELSGGRRWHYDGTLDIGTGGVLPGSLARRTVTARVEVRPPEDPEAEPAELELVATEPLR